MKIVTRKLKQKDCNGEYVIEILDLLDEQGFIVDSSYAISYLQCICWDMTHTEAEVICA